jgi:peptide/nickel transport system ATP-binding protein
VLNLMQDLQDLFGVTYLFISHDLSVVDLVCDEVVVLQAGRIVEQGPPQRLFQRPEHPYTQRLLAAVPGLVPSAPAGVAKIA